MIFDGKAFAAELGALVRGRVAQMKRQPKIVSILVGDEVASALYTRLKQAAADRVGIQFEVIKVDAGISSQELGIRIREIGSKEDVTGVMVQLPIPGMSRAQQEQVLAVIPLEKDVDGLRWEVSGVKPAAVRAVLSIVERIAQGKTRYAVLGAGGAVGRPLTLSLSELGHSVSAIEADTPHPAELTSAAEVVISCVGKAGLVTADMVSNGLIAIDVGMSQVDGKVVGDMTSEVYQKASVAVTVPGGVGPVTVASLMANAADLPRRQAGLVL